MSRPGFDFKGRPISHGDHEHDPNCAGCVTLRALAAEDERDRLRQERNETATQLGIKCGELRDLRSAITALADQYQTDADKEGYGGELWSTTATAVRALLNPPTPEETP